MTKIAWQIDLLAQAYNLVRAKNGNNRSHGKLAKAEHLFRSFSSRARQYSVGEAGQRVCGVVNVRDEKLPFTKAVIDLLYLYLTTVGMYQIEVPHWRGDNLHTVR
jgi:hypothetical protein